MANSLPFGRRPEPCLQLVPPLDTPRRDWPARCQNSPATPCGITLAARIAARPSRHLSYKSALWDHSRHHVLVSTRVPREIMESAFQRCPRAPVSSANAPRRVRQRKGLPHFGLARGAAFRIARRASCRNMHPGTVTETQRSLMNARQPVTYPCLIRQG